MNPAQNSDRTSLRAGAVPLPRDQVIELHKCERSPVLKMIGDAIGFFGAGALAVAGWYSGYYLLVVPPLIIAGHFGHIVPLMFHDASHGTLHPVKWKNEAIGMFCGMMILVPLSAYRYAHALHHRCPGTERDPELWPFTNPGVPRWVRIGCAFVEILLGCLYTPFLFLKCVLTADNLTSSQKQRIGIEYAITAIYWAGTIALFAWLELWTVFLLALVMPIVIAGALQSLNKYVEHMGVLGAGAIGSTRSVADERLFGRLFSASWQHVDHHGAHHLYARIPHYHLPETTPLVMSEEAVRETLYPTYFSAFVAMLKTLGNPRVGAQWMPAESPAPSSTAPWETCGGNEFEKRDSRDVQVREQIANQRA